MNSNNKIILLFTALLSWLMAAFFKLLIAAVVLLTIVGLGTWYVTKPANEFCDSIDPDDDLLTVESKASSQGYRLFSYEDGERLTVRIPNQDSPFFRMACVVTFTNGVITNKEVLADD